MVNLLFQPDVLVLREQVSQVRTHDCENSAVHTLAEIYTVNWKVHDRWVLLLHKVVLGESLEVQNNVRWQPRASEPFQLPRKLLRGLPIIFGEYRRE